MYHKILLSFFLFFSFVGQAFAEPEIYTGILSNKAAGGYDVVSYFSENSTPVKGVKAHKTSWRGADWYFASQENLDAFKKNPTAYAPQYGGYCAWAAAHDTLAKGDPTIYHIENGKLYFNYDKKINDSWLPRRAELIPVADTLYPKLIVQ